MSKGNNPRVSYPYAIPDSGEIGLNAARDRLVFSLVESTGNVWLAKIGER